MPRCRFDAVHITTGGLPHKYPFRRKNYLLVFDHVLEALGLFEGRLAKLEYRSDNYLGPKIDPTQHHDSHEPISRSRGCFAHSVEVYLDLGNSF